MVGQNIRMLPHKFDCQDSISEPPVTILIESGRFCVLGRVVDLRIDSWAECWIPSSESILPLLVEYTGSDLKQKMCSALTPRHLLAFCHSLADDLIDC